MIKVGIIGVGNMGRSHCKNIKEGKCPEIELVAIADAEDYSRFMGYEDVSQLYQNYEIYISALNNLKQGTVWLYES